MEKKIRFGDLVRNSGRPQVFTLWSNPKTDKTFQKAIHQNRVLTITQDPTSKTRDFGNIGFHEKPHASYLIFPKPLPEDKNSRVIGINYQLIEEAEVTDRVSAKTLEPKPKPSKAKPELKLVKPEPVLKNFTVTIRRTATIEETASVKAEDESAAQAQALQIARQKAFELKRATQKEEVLSVE